MANQVQVSRELHDLLDKALAYADEEEIRRLYDLMLCLSEGAGLVDFTCDVPEGLEHNPVLHRLLRLRNLLTDAPAGHA